MKSVINYRTKIVSDCNLVEEAILCFIFNNNEGKSQPMQFNMVNWNPMQDRHYQDKYEAEILTLYSNPPKQTLSHTVQIEVQVK